ncbi:hypothetical protein L484_021177 [Morus notabilis]|uniref:Uncharacterized protein n=1 Tax=Morus notabilis TaxID=981085 RepID=W9QQZ1_9ROSA|nr:hypothetical protein L484_021177 [Morus notabilis]
MTTRILITCSCYQLQDSTLFCLLDTRGAGDFFEDRHRRRVSLSRRCGGDRREKIGERRRRSPRTTMLDGGCDFFSGSAKISSLRHFSTLAIANAEDGGEREKERSTVEREKETDKSPAWRYVGGGGDDEREGERTEKRKERERGM